MSVPEPHWFDVSHYELFFGTSYDAIESFCDARNMRLCTFEEYCPQGEFGELYFNIPREREAYAPYFSPNGKSRNNWLQVGFPDLPIYSPEYFNKQCWDYKWDWLPGYEHTGRSGPASEIQ